MGERDLFPRLVATNLPVASGVADFTAMDAAARFTDHAGLANAFSADLDHPRFV